jgi:hypothetical protein
VLLARTSALASSPDWFTQADRQQHSCSEEDIGSKDREIKQQNLLCRSTTPS